MKVSIEELKDLANRLKFDMHEDEYKTLQDEFEVVLYTICRASRRIFHHRVALHF